jgi:hypothetical protein
LNNDTSQKYSELRKYVSVIRGAKKGLPYNVNEMTHEDFFFYLKALSGSPGSNFSKTAENEAVKMTDIKTVKVDKRSPYAFFFKSPTVSKITKKLQ